MVFPLHRQQGKHETFTITPRGKKYWVESLDDDGTRKIRGRFHD